MFGKHPWKRLAALGAAVLTMTLAACGGGSGGSGSTTSGADAGALSTGTITAFGSVFVNGHEFDTRSAQVVDDDTGATVAASQLEVGMVVDVKAGSGSSADHPEATELRLHPLARGYVDASDATAGTITVMGQTVQLTSATNYSDHRACVSATTSPCTAVAAQADLAANAGAASSYVTVHGYLYTGSAGSTNIVATLVSVGDVPTGTGVLAFKAEGVVSATGTNTVTIGGLTANLGSATCRVKGAPVDCASAFSAGQVVSVGSGTLADPLPVTTFTASRARLAGKLAVETDGATVELEGSVSGVGATSFVLRGITVDASSLVSAGTALPAVGDIVRVVGTVAQGGQAVTASSLKVLHLASARTYGLEGDASGVAAGSDASTYTLSVLGQTITVTANTRLADRQSGEWRRTDPAANPFNIGTFQAYLAASASQHLLVKAQTDAGGNLVAQSLMILPASTVATIAGPVDASPAPVNSSATGTPSTFSVHGVAVSADPAAIFAHRLGERSGSGAVTIAAGDVVVARGSYAAGTITVTATPSLANGVLDLGVLQRRDRCGL